EPGHARDARDGQRIHSHGVRRTNVANSRGQHHDQLERRRRRRTARLLGAAVSWWHRDRTAREADVGRRVRRVRRPLRHPVDGKHPGAARLRAKMADKNRYRGGGGNAVYALGLIGALFYYIRAADGFWDGVLGVLQALVWPAFLVYHVLKYL